jgi:thioredoxin-like negative regulator of GroEL
VTISLALNILLQLAAANPTSTAETQDYATAYKQMTETGKPLVVLIGAEWCPGCVQMKKTAMPEVKKNGGLTNVAYAYVSADDQNGLAQKLMRGGSIPQLILYYKGADGWKRQQLTGAHSPSAIQSFLDQANQVPQVTRLPGGAEK